IGGAGDQDGAGWNDHVESYMKQLDVAVPKLHNGWMNSASSVTNAKENTPKTRTMSQCGSGSGNPQTFVHMDHAFYRMHPPPNQMMPNEMMYAKSPADHTRNTGEDTSDRPFAPSFRMQNMMSNNVAHNDTLFAQEQYLKFKNIIIKGCESAERLAYFHRNRPCFKKINCLCARLKQDVNRADSVLANINSQGVPWAVKDFIFVFTRIVSAWNIIKDYVYNTSDGMRTIKSAISDRLVDSFLKWQEVTSVFVEDIIKSFDGLQELTTYQIKQSECQRNAEANSLANESKNFVSDSESFESFKAHKDSIHERSSSSDHSSSDDGQLHPNVKQLLVGSNGNFEYIKTGIYNCTVVKQQNNLNNNGFQSENGIRVDDVKKFYGPNFVYVNPYTALPPKMAVDKFHWNVTPADITQGLMEMKLRKNLKSDLLQKVCFIEESKFFFSSQFTKNYFPDFLKIVPNFVDLRSIIVQSEMEILNDIHEVVHQIRQIFFGAKIYIKERPNELLKSYVIKFEDEFEKLLARDFSAFSFKQMNEKM
ncbi:Protein mitoshell, partial [Pseudolycoriella hygida]